ncbi:MAG: TlpA family protein disulfide reductase [Alphaproteobacteria bacterium]|nr:TlpA family protein disulfide reductase [Alphaproteobacteria bacterium]
MRDQSYGKPPAYASLLAGLFLCLFLLAAPSSRAEEETADCAVRGAALSEAAATFTEGFRSFSQHDSGAFLGDVTVYDMADQPHTLFPLLEGRYTLINLWATWCAPCRKELPSLVSLETMRGGEDFDVLFVSMEYPDDAAALSESMARRGIKGIMPYYVTDYDIWQSVQAFGLPVTLLVDPEGQIVDTMEGDAVWDSPAALAFLEEATGRSAEEACP